MNLSALGEFGLIERLARDLPNNPGQVVCGAGDDAAVLQAAGPDQLLFTTDMLVEEVHFSLTWATAEQVGVKALAVNVSDIAAMGGRPAYAVISLGVPERVTVEELDALYRGLRRTAREYGVNLVGGDTVACPDRLVINVALLGLVEPGRAVYRGGARPGDLIYVTGSLGKSAAGLFLCRHPETPVVPEAAAFARLAHLEPCARVQAGRLLAAAGVGAMDDISDGLAGELGEICRASGAGCRVRAGAVPVDPRVRLVAAAAGCDPLDWALYGGEDFELLFTVSPAGAARMEDKMAQAGEAVSLIGEITPAGDGMKIETGGVWRPLPARGYDHFLR
ncbi:thiamine-phosphate kinase [Desulfotomaculum copahuensis]|uniref:Thiamine-monophosphate kinase n=1 Tax=Desulfotomaculum copahuensis TaxID=1838280 RepID=A0A1B7LBS3_9FIRM|nr:thiamine-phosphate kinase [Desulfotomaculum copahuensis]OAT79961.1 thiamine-phosphate kinase [Desulfotomaculum copahuensis]